jgi:DNA-binding Lrp family transcriptional regulator
MLGIPSSTVHDRLRRFRKIGVRYTTLIHWEAMGCSLRVCVLTSYTNVHKILNHPNVNNCFHVSPDLILIEGVFSSMMEIERFQSFLPSARLYTVVEVLKKEGFKHR